MRFKFTFFLLVLNLIVFSLIVYLGSRADDVASEDRSLASIIAGELTEADRIVLEAESLQQSRILAMSGSSWILEEPIRWPANQFAVNRILNRLQFIEDEASFSVAEIERNGQTLEDYGLQNPAISLTIFNGDKPFKLGFGTLTEIGNNVYVLGPNSERVYVVNRESVDGLLLSLSDLRKREIFEIPVFEVQEMSLQLRPSESGTTGDLKVRLAKTQGVWAFEAPLNAQADPAQVSNTINTLATVKVTEFFDETGLDEIDAGLEEPFMRVTLFGNKRRQTLLIGNALQSTELAEEQYIAQIEGNSAIFTVSAAPFDDLLEAQEALRERNFLSFEGRVIDSIFITENTRQTRLQKLENGTWQVLESHEDGKIEPRRADSEIVTNLISTLGRLRAVEFAVDSPTSVDLDRLGFNSPRRTVDLIFADDGRIRLEIAHPDDENVKLFARTDQAEFIYEVDRRATLKALPLNALHYRNRTLEALPKSATIRSIRIIEAETDAPVISVRRNSPSEQWQGDYTRLGSEEKDSLQQLVDAIQEFRVKRYLRDFYAASFPLEAAETIPWKYSLIAEVFCPGSGEDQIREIEISLTRRLSGNSQIGGSARHDTMFEIPQELIEAIYTLTVPFDLPPEAEGKEVPLPAPIEPVPPPSTPQG